jgi:hypothetical protein
MNTKEDNEAQDGPTRLSAINGDPGTLNRSLPDSSEMETCRAPMALARYENVYRRRALFHTAFPDEMLLPLDET